MARFRGWALAGGLSAGLWGGLALLSGCSVISSDLRGQAAPVEGLTELRENLEWYRGEVVILGGEVEAVRNEDGATALVVRERPLGFGQRPDAGEAGGGRFVLRFDEFLDPEVYEEGRRVTVAGIVSGLDPAGRVVLEGEEVYLWKEPSRYRGPPAYHPQRPFPYRRYPYRRHPPHFYGR